MTCSSSTDVDFPFVMEMFKFPCQHYKMRKKIKQQIKTNKHNKLILFWKLSSKTSPTDLGLLSDCLLNYNNILLPNFKFY